MTEHDGNDRDQTDGGDAPEPTPVTPPPISESPAAPSATGVVADDEPDG